MKLEHTENYKQGVALAKEALAAGKSELEALDGVGDLEMREAIRATYGCNLKSSFSDAVRSLRGVSEGKVSISDAILACKALDEVVDSDSDEYSLEKVNAREYDVLKNGVPTYKLEQKQSNWTCTCPAFKYRGRCRHLGLLSDILPKRHPRAELEAFVPEIQAMFEPVFGKEYSDSNPSGKWAIVGSYRRGKDTFKDIDILVECPKGEFEKKILPMLEADPEYKKVVSGPDIIRGYYHGYEFDVSRVQPGEWASYLLYRTGSAKENIRLRSLAKQKGWRLNEHGLVDESGSLITNESERAIYEALGTPYKTPEERE